MVTSSTEARALLTRGDITLKGRLPRSSNATFLAEVTLGEARALAVYKPERGERPLWDFPPGLFKRELAACQDRLIQVARHQSSIGREVKLLPGPRLSGISRAERSRTSLVMQPVAASRTS